MVGSQMHLLANRGKSPLGSGTQEGIWQGSLSHPAVEHTHNEMSLQTRRMSKLSLVYV